jgi:integration host factor subunit beta
LAHEARATPGTKPGNESMATITKKDLVDRIAARMTNCPRADVKQVIQSFLDGIVDELGRGNRLEFRDFGVFEVKERAARVAQNPKTLVPVKVPPKRTVKFKVGRLMKEQLDVPVKAGKPQVVVNPDIAANGRVPRNATSS